MKMNKKGFTLIELLIVVAIIAILAAIAIPQFSAYRIKGYNAAATADLRNARTAEESFFSDWQVYSSSAAAGAPGAGNVSVHTANNTGAIAAGSIAGAPTNAPSALINAPGFFVGISQNVVSSSIPLLPADHLPWRQRTRLATGVTVQTLTLRRSTG